MEKLYKSNRLYLIPYNNRIKNDSDYQLFTDKLISIIFDYALLQSDSIDYIISIYDKYYQNYLELQNSFTVTGKYKYSTYKELSKNLETDFHKNYIYVLLISFMTTSYRYDLMNFITDLIAKNLKNGNEDGLEIGFGSGIDLLFREKYFKKYEIFDINQYSKIIFELLFKNNNVYSFSNTFYTFSDTEKFTFVQFIELLEHLENPSEYINSAYKVLKHGGSFVFTAAVNMANIDHIYHFHNVDSVRKMIDERKWEIMAEEAFVNSLMKFPKQKISEIINDNKAPFILVYFLKKK